MMAKSMQDVIETQVEQAMQDHEQDVFLNVLKFNNQRQQCNISKEVNDITNERYDLTMMSFQNSSISVTDVNLAQTEKDVNNVLVVPKSAVVIRDNYNVIFRYDDKVNKSIWTYISIVMENSHSYVVTGNEDKNTSIAMGDKVIISGNLNIADGSDVQILK